MPNRPAFQTIPGPIVSMRGISKSFPGVLANDQLDLDIYASEIHALLGENGAPSTANVPIISNAARAWLSQGQRGKVLASVDHATYLLTEHGELVWLATTESPKHRRCIQWPTQLPSLAVDSPFSIQGQSITLEPGTILNFRDLRGWEDKSLPVNDIIEIKQLPAKLIAVGETIIAGKTPMGFGSFIRPVLQIAEEQNSSTEFQPEDIFATTAWPIVERIAKACLSHDLPTVLPHAERLIGLGEGLTPSGDDFLGGLLFARYLLSCSYPHLLYLELSNLTEWIDANQPRTNLISFVLLKDNAAGYALDPLNRLGIALLTNQTVENANFAASDLLSVGHSTGWSLLTGFLVGMLLTFTDYLLNPRP